jgi:O-antigen/teichoic acid export membrane protein
VGAGLALIARDAVTVMFGTGDTAAVPTMEIISVTGAVVGLGYATGDLLFATNRPGVMMRLNAVMVPVMLLAMWLVAPHGIVWVALVHLATAVVFTLIRQLIVNRIIGATLWPCLAACWPGVAVAIGMLAVGLPVRLATDAGAVSGLLVTVAVTVGALIALGVSRASRNELRDLVAKLRGS